ncbi:hypothetical protein KGY73_01000 [bacterium]|nr:hypothetical protein [bacterium]
MKKLVLFTLTGLFLSALLTGCGGAGGEGGEKEPNNSIGEASAVSLEKTFPITINPEGDVDWFKVELPEQGYLKVQAGEVPEDLGLKVSFAVYEEWEGEKEKKLRGWNDLPDAVSIPEEGTYYFAIKDHHDDAFSKKPVNIKAAFVKEFDSWEPNDSPEEAAEVKVGSIIRPAIFPAGDQDWFKVSVKEQGYLRIQSKDIPEGITPQVLYATYDEWADPKVEKIRSWSRLPDACFVPDSGDYLIRLHDDHDNEGSESTFDLKIDFLEEMDEAEPNDEFENAKSVSRGDTLTVAIFPKGDKDYFKIKNDKGEMLKLKAEGFSEEIVPEAKLFIRDEENPDKLKEVSDWKKLPGKYEVKKSEEYFILLHDDYDNKGSSKTFKLLVE